MGDDLRSRPRRIGGTGIPNRQVASNEKQGKENAGDGGRARSLQTLMYRCGSWFIAASNKNNRVTPRRKGSAKN
jgi:hypothetical protein